MRANNYYTSLFFSLALVLEMRLSSFGVVRKDGTTLSLLEIESWVVFFSWFWLGSDLEVVVCLVQN